MGKKINVTIGASVGMVALPLGLAAVGLSPVGPVAGGLFAVH